jgi:hypothetical protein
MNRNTTQDIASNLLNYTESLSQRAQRAMRPNGAGAPEALETAQHVIAFAPSSERTAEPGQPLFNGPSLSKRIR